VQNNLINAKNIAWWSLVAILLLATPILGTLAAIIALIITLLTLPVIFTKDAKKSIFKQPMIIMFIAGFLLFFISSLITAKSPNDIRYIFNFLAFILAIPIYLIAKEKAGKKTTILLLSLCFIGATIALGIAIYDIYFRSFARAEGFFSGAILFARVGATLGFIAGMGFFLIKSPLKYLFLLAPIFGIFITILAQSRGTLITLPILSLLYFSYSYRRAKTKIVKLSMILFLIILAILTFILLGEYSGRIANIISVISQVSEGGISSDESANIRLDFYTTGWQLFTQNPWIGYGWANMSEQVYSILNPANYEIILVEKFHFHNDFFNFAVAGGVLAIMSYFLFICAPLIGAIYSKKDKLYFLRLEIIIILVALYFISGLTDMVIGYDLPTTMFALLSAIIIGAIRDKPA